MFSWPKIVTRIGNILFSIFDDRTIFEQNARNPKILVVRFKRGNDPASSVGIGDLVLLTPFLKTLKEKYPDSQIDFVMSPEHSRLYKNCPYLHEIIEYEFTSIYSMFKMTNRLRKRAYNLLYFPRYGTSKWFVSLFCYLTQAKKRVTYSEHVNAVKEKTQKDYDMLFTDTLDDKEVVHEALRYLKLVYFEQNKLNSFSETVGQLELWPSKEDMLLARDIMRSLGEKRKIVALGIGARSERRKWPVELWMQTMVQLIASVPDISFVILGGNDASFEAEYLSNAFPKHVVNITGKTSYLETYAIIQLCDLYVGNDSGGVHIASAAQTPCVVISCHPFSGEDRHANSPKRFSPYAVKHIVLQPGIPAEGSCVNGCVKDYAHCISEITPEEVVRAICRMLD